ncbi:zinc ribbon domain-containing protein [Anaerovorax odorimutans]|uniref:zinc ribbon domain-containing protein n=1 Tax=Anaerovorax odorimutans TaxID=109327 RepID=UPI00041DF65F|nr:zinc ribbon domain-containing protein [Anaerovorax odorimutans]
MAFFDKLNDIAKSIGDMTNDAIETNKLNSRITDERDAINELICQIGEYYYEKHRLGDTVDTEVYERMLEIDQHYDAIKEAEVQLDAIKVQASVDSNSGDLTVEGGIICPICGKQNAYETKFCQECGNKLEQPQHKTCPSCGMIVTDGLKFCGECGTKME